tara:strand:+ start:1117 stop:1251 length:135 start_codon:yes stop_codon:yes gene_type:complete
LSEVVNTFASGKILGLMHPEGGLIGLPTSVEKKESYLKGNLHIY